MNTETLTTAAADHTPGPWTAEILPHRDGYNYVHVKSEQGDIIEPTKAYDIEQANGCLIAAAPELLEALRYALVGVEHHAEEFKTKFPSKWESSRIKERLEFCRATIAKAEGRS